MELPYTIFALGDAQLHQLHTEDGNVSEGPRPEFVPSPFLSLDPRDGQILVERERRVPLLTTPLPDASLPIRCSSCPRWRRSSSKRAPSRLERCA